MIFRRTLFTLGCLVAGASLAGAADKPKPARIVAGISSADGLIADLEYIVDKLAGQKQQWQKNVLPNLEVFLIGVSTDRPVRMDTVIDAESGKRSVFVIPVTKDDLKTFRDDNLEPIGIGGVRVGGDPTLYELDGDVLAPETWWMRHAFDYSILSKAKGDVAKDIEDPATLQKGLFDTDKHYDLAVRLLTKASDREGRLAAVKKLREESDASLKEAKDGETPAQFERRKYLANQQLSLMQTIFAECSELFVGWTTDSEAGKAFADIRIAALEGSELEQTGSELGTRKSHFAAIPEAKDPVLKSRINLVTSSATQARVSEFAKLSEPVWHERTDKNEKLNAEQKTAVKKVYTALAELLKKNAGLGVLDIMAELTKQPSGKHVLVAGLRVSDGSAIKTLVEQLPVVNDRWSVKLDADKIGDVSVHQITNKKATDVVKTFWGSGDMFAAIGPETIWLAKGEGAVEVLKTYIEKQKGNEEPKDVSKFATLRLHAKPIMYVADSFWDEMDIDLSKLLQSSGLMGEKKEKPKPTRPGQKAGEQKSSTRDQLKNFKWAQAAHDAMTGEIDVIDVVFTRNERSVDAVIDIQKDILKAAGEVIAKFAKENLQ